HHPLPLGPREPELRAQRHHDRGHVRRADGPAARAGGRHPADMAVLLHAEVDRLAPLVGLIVVVAARIETEIAAQRAHVAEQGSGDELGGARDSVVVLSDGWVRTELREADAGPDHASRITHLASRQLPNPHPPRAGARGSARATRFPGTRWGRSAALRPSPCGAAP